MPPLLIPAFFLFTKARRSVSALRLYLNLTDGPDWLRWQAGNPDAGEAMTPAMTLKKHL